MPDHQEIYSKQADQYESLVAREDYQQNIFPTLKKITSLDGLRVVEFGAGTGRLTRLLAPVVKSIYAFDRSQHMLDIAAAKLQEINQKNWQLVVSDHRNIPIADNIADITISGWSIAYLVVENKETWREELSKALHEMHRISHPEGTLILVETLGTGSQQPNPPVGLVPYYEYLEECGFQHTWLRTDYLFQDTAEADELTRFFFGDAMTKEIRQEAYGTVLPECTGIWSLKADDLFEKE